MFCLVEGCDRQAVSRGVCARCYRVCAQRVRRGKATWEELVQLGIVTESKHKNAGRSGIVTQMIERRRQEIGRSTDLPGQQHLFDVRPVNQPQPATD